MWTEYSAVKAENHQDTVNVWEMYMHGEVGFSQWKEKKNSQ